MKKISLLLLLLCLAAFTAACGDNKETSSESAAESITESAEESEATIVIENINDYIAKSGTPLEKYAYSPFLADNAEGTGIIVSPHLADKATLGVLIEISDLYNNDMYNSAHAAADRFVTAGISAFIVTGCETAEDVAVNAPKFITSRPDEFGVTELGVVVFDEAAALLIEKLPEASFKFIVLGNPVLDEATVKANISSTSPLMYCFYKTGSGEKASNILNIFQSIIKPSGVKYELHGFMSSAENPLAFGLYEDSYFRSVDNIITWLNFNKVI